MQDAFVRTADEMSNNTTDEKIQRAKEILSHFQAMSWHEGIRIAFACNRNLVSLVGVQMELFPTLLSLLAQENRSSVGTNFGLESAYAILLRCPDAIGGDRI